MPEPTITTPSKDAGKLPPGMVLGPDGKPCKICTAFRHWKPTESISASEPARGTRPNGKSAAAAMAALAYGTGSAATTTPDVRPEKCPPDVEILGRATWTFLHTTAAYYPEKPTPSQRVNMLSLIRSLPILYPCTHCASHLDDNIKANPPDVSGRMFVQGLRTRTFKLLAFACLVILGCIFYASNYYEQFRQPAIAPPLRLPVHPVNHPDSEAHKLWNLRAEEVKEAFLYAYRGYKRFARHQDELKPITNRGINNFNGWGLTVVDSLDTMWMMDLQDEFQQALPFVANLTFDLDEAIIVIRYVGGLLSAYALSNETILLDRAEDLAQKLLPAFNTSINLPAFSVNTVTGETDEGRELGTAWLAEVMSCQMEYKYLAHLTGKAEYFEKANVIKRMKVKKGMLPTKLSMDTGGPMNHRFSVGAYADSAYEYMLKQWLLSSRVETKSEKLYLRTVSAILENLLYLSTSRHLLYVTDVDSKTNPPKPSYIFEHLSCFLPGLLALGAHTLPASVLSPRDKQLHLWAAEGLANTCYVLYADQPSGLGPEEVQFHSVPFKFGRRGEVEDVSSGFIGFTPEQRRKREGEVDDVSSGNIGHTPKQEKRSEGLVRGRWMEHVREWEWAGKPGGVPPGVRDPKPAVTGKRDYASRRHEYLLRPETVETFYLMWRTTGDPKWRERGWDVFQAIELHTKTPTGYASIQTVEQTPSPRLDEMPSYFLAETLKYLYLLFREDDLIPLDRWVFNTEAHPLPMFEWTAEEKRKYRIY
ncbi:hypothetical protein EUX98_g6396 [Antrodiella citrinella]|uniref:Multifunctional fusion protein n=1 Tax=Antrodiella citrinella TaxID=2447956 RepID=A0A4S4MPE3_9APHY|nr:hypothetical protein EUX98_g6396 [Antrodiella citrinella]